MNSDHKNRSYSSWREAIQAAKTLPTLKAIGEDLGQFQKQSGLFGDEEKKLADPQIETLRKLYSEKMKKLVAETMDNNGSTKPEFKK